MTYKLAFGKSAMKEWHKLAPPLQQQFKKKLAQCLDNPHRPAARLHGLPDCYKIKLRNAGYRLVYQVEDAIVTVKVVAVGKRNRNDVYHKAKDRV